MKLPFITNIQKYSIHDGEGIRTTVFFKGCPLSCVWCHNPETQKYENCPLFYAERCIGCTSCIYVCPEKAIHLEDGRAVTDIHKCVSCGTCLDECFYNAREICGKTYPEAELVKELVKDMAFYETSHGGVTLSGGEVLANNLDYVESLMRKLTQRGIRVNIDTCGAVPFGAIERVLPYTDTFLYDIKILDAQKHQAYTGRSNTQILENLIKLSEKKRNVRNADTENAKTGKVNTVKIWIRIPVIGGVNDSAEEIAGIGRFLRDSHICAEQMNLIPYHNTGSSKYSRMFREYEGNEFYTPGQEQMEQLKEIIGKFVDYPVKIGG